MVRFRCSQCGKTVEYLRIYHKDEIPRICSCGGKLLPVHDNSNYSTKGGVKNEDRHAGKERSS